MAYGSSLFKSDRLGEYSTAIGGNANIAYEGSIVTGGRNDTTFGTSIRDTAGNQVIQVAELPTAHSKPA